MPRNPVIRRPSPEQSLERLQRQVDQQLVQLRSLQNTVHAQATHTGDRQKRVTQELHQKAPDSAEYVLSKTQTGLLAGRVLTDTATVTWDNLTPRQVKANALSEIVTNTFTVTGTGFTDPDPTGTARYIAVSGRFAMVFLPALSGTSDATTFTLTGIPAAIQPAALTTHLGGIAVLDNGVAESNGYIRVNAASGTWDVFRTAALLAWTASGNKALLRAPTLAYLLF